MDASFELRTTNGHKRIMKFSFLPNGEVHADLVAVGGYRSPGGAVYKCSNWYKNKIINTSGIKSNSNNFNSKNSSSTKFSSNTKRISDEAICNMATDRGSWRKAGFAQEYVQEAKKRGLSCGVYSSTSLNLSNYSDWKVCDEADSGKPEWIKEAKYRGLNCGSSTSTPSSTPSSTSSLLQNYSDWKVCDEVKSGKVSWLEEAKRRRLNCGVNAAEAEKKKQTQLRKIAAEAKKEEKARQERIKAEQEKIKKKAAEKALKKKIAEEKARQKKKAEEEARQKRLAEEKRKQELARAKLNKQIANYKRKAANFYKDIESYVKSGGNVDLVKLSDFFDLKPNPNNNWNQSDLSRYEKLREFMISIPQFVSYEKKRIGERLKNSFAMKDKSVAELKQNLKELNTLMRKMFGSSEVPKIKNMIKDIQLTLSDFNQTVANKVLRKSSTYIASKSPKSKKENRITKVTSSLDKNWLNVEDDLSIQQKQFCQLTDRFYDNLNRARKSKNEIKVNIVHKERQENLDALIPQGNIDNWIFKVIKIDQVEDGSAAVVLGLQCRSFVGSGQTIDIKRGMSKKDKKEWRATIPYNDRRFRELAKLDQGQFIVGSGTMLEIKAYKPGQKETFYASQQIGEHPLTKDLNLEGELFIADLSYIAALNK